MKIKNLELIKKDERGKLFLHNNLEIIKRKKESISANHQHVEEEEIFLIDGKVILTVGNETQKITQPSKILIPSNTYHKIEALTDIILIANKK